MMGGRRASSFGGGPTKVRWMQGRPPPLTSPRLRRTSGNLSSEGMNLDVLALIVPPRLMPVQ